MIQLWGRSFTRHTHRINLNWEVEIWIGKPPLAAFVASCLMHRMPSLTVYSVLGVNFGPKIRISWAFQRIGKHVDQIHINDRHAQRTHTKKMPSHDCFTVYSLHVTSVGIVWSLDNISIFFASLNFTHSLLSSRWPAFFFFFSCHSVSHTLALICVCNFLKQFSSFDCVYFCINTVMNKHELPSTCSGCDACDRATKTLCRIERRLEICEK